MVRFLFTSTLIISPFPNYLPNSSGSELLVILHMQADVGPFMPPKVLEHAYLKAGCWYYIWVVFIVFSS